ncbi:helix-turn-helix transcriptional regulator [Streptomyces sp. NPDC093252]|uniref:helix-turn-helix domain-containing protein n=1 Tax=Streptomyces sp. NPDC093252 TaxID=3154980 RepID=UPI00343F8BF7
MSQRADQHIGARIADYRKIRHMTQASLAQRAYVSHSSLAKVEAGLVPASPALVAATARVLQVDVAVLNGQPYMSQMRQDQIDHLIRPLGEALDLYDIEPDPHIRPRPVAHLDIAVTTLLRHNRLAEYGRVGSALPGLLGELTTALHTLPQGEQRRRVAAGLANTYWAAHGLADRLGYPDLASIALDRMGWVGVQADDPLLLAVRHYARSLRYVRRNNPRVGLLLVERGQQLVQQADDPRSVPALAVSGKLHLRAAFIAARAQDQDTSEGHLDLGKGAARQIGRDVPETYWLSFGPTDVAQYEVETNVDLKNMPAAVKAAKSLRFPAGHSPTRVGRHFMDLGRAYAHMGRNEQALNALLRARGTAPQLVRYHPTAREVVGVLVRRQRRLPEQLTSLAGWVGMA